MKRLSGQILSLEFYHAGRLPGDRDHPRPDGDARLGWLRLAGAAYLVWLGWKMIRAADGAYALQIAVMGVTAMIFAAVADGSYAVLAGGAAKLLMRRHARLLSRAAGGFLIDGGIWLALSRAR